MGEWGIGSSCKWGGWGQLQFRGERFDGGTQTFEEVLQMEVWQV